jgi:hypothetical protein
LYATVAGTGTPIEFESVTVVELIVDGVIEREKLPTTVAERPMPVAPESGATGTTVGGAGSGEGTAARSMK